MVKRLKTIVLLGNRPVRHQPKQVSRNSESNATGYQSGSQQGQAIG